MRELTVEEIRSLVIAGGAQSMTKVLVTAPWIPSPTSGSTSFGAGSLGLFTSPGSGPVGGGHGMLAAPVGGGGGGVMNNELKNALEALVKEASISKFSVDIQGNLADAVAAGKINAITMSTTWNDFQRGFESYNGPAACGCIGSAQDSYLPWQNLNWTLIDPQQNLTEGQFIARMAQLTSHGVNIWSG